MLKYSRILFTSLWWFCLFRGDALADSHRENDALVYFVWAVILSIPVSAVWTPFIASVLFGPIIHMFDDAEMVQFDDTFIKWIGRLNSKRHRRLIVFLCFIEGVLHPELPFAFITGMNHAKPGSWLEILFAREVYRFNNAQNCRKALEILRRNNINPGLHDRAEINMLLFESRRISFTAPKPAKLLEETVAPVLRKTDRILAELARKTELPAVGKNGTQRLPRLSA